MSNRCAAVTPSDTQDLPCGSDELSFVNSGTQTLQVTMLGDAIGGDPVSPNIVSGIILPSGKYTMRVKRVWATGTTVTNIFTWWTG